MANSSDFLFIFSDTIQAASSNTTSHKDGPFSDIYIYIYTLHPLVNYSYRFIWYNDIGISSMRI